MTTGWKSYTLDLADIIETYINIWMDRPSTITLTTLQHWRDDLLNTVFGDSDIDQVLCMRNINPESIRKYIRLPKKYNGEITKEKLHMDISAAILLYKNLLKEIGAAGKNETDC